jgi:hypothetical protein
MIDGRLMEEDRVGERATARTKPQRIEKRILRIADNWQLTGNGGRRRKAKHELQKR